jgi:hypothetical protein
MHGKHMVKFLSTTQAPINLSSGESEWHAAVRSGSALVGFVNLLADFGRTLPAVLCLDASATIGIASRRGVGKIRHLDVDTLWLQWLVTHRKVKLEKVDGKVNVADLGTKHLDGPTLRRLLEILGFYFAEGRSKLALRAALGQ